MECIFAHPSLSIFEWCDLGWDNHLSIIFFFPQNANVTFKAVKTTTVDLTVANVNVKKDIQEFIASCQ